MILIVRLNMFFITLIGFAIKSIYSDSDDDELMKRQ